MKKTSIKIESDDIFSYFYQLSVENNGKKLFGESSEKDSHYYGIDAFYNIPTLNKNLEKIYRDSNKSILIMNLIDSCLRLFNQYFKINGLDQLLSTNYFNVEYNMYFEHDFHKNDSTYYREHFLHQFRNAHLGLILMSEFDFENGVIESLKNSNYYYALFLSEYNTNDINLKYIAYKSFFLACLFHDIGYPLSYYRRLSNEITKSLPYNGMLNNNIFKTFFEVKSLLKDSLLFRTKNQIDIENKYKNGDHGVLSAIAFLTHFYNNGQMYQKNENSAILELAAIAIYEHTDKYMKNERIISSNNPISYMLRVCDDLQEWDRVRFNIGSSKSYLQCSNNCLGSLELISSNNYRKEYKCNVCNNLVYDNTKINYDKIDFDSFCDFIEICKQNDDVLISIHYDELSQLEVLCNDPKVNDYRIKELNLLSGMFELQMNYPDIVIKHNLLKNPVELAKIIIGCIKKLELENVLVEYLKTPENQRHFEEFWIILNKTETDLVSDVSINQQQMTTNFILKYYNMISEIVRGKENLPTILVTNTADKI